MTAASMNDTALKAGTTSKVTHRSTLIVRDADSVLGVCENVVVMHWHLHTTEAKVRALHEVVQRTGLQYKAGIALIQIPGPNASVPGAEARRLLGELLRTASPALISSSLVLIGTGFRMSAARALATGLTLIARQKFPHVVHASIAEASEFHSSALRAAGANTLPAHAIAAAIRDLA
jgi:hypothetical protein